MINSLVFLTRGCPRACKYCAIRDAKDVGQELNTEQWKEAFDILKNLGVSFNLILGNETWLLRDALPQIISHTTIPYAIYTTCPEPLFSETRDEMFKVIDNLSCGLDWPLSYLEKKEVLTEDSERKSLDAWKAFKWLKKHHPKMDCQGNITAHRKNISLVPEIIAELSELGVFSGINFIHWNKDGKFDFFPIKSEIQDFTFDESSYPVLESVFEKVLNNPGLLQNPEVLQEPLHIIVNMGWHCNGNPYGGPTVDSDGTLRVCGYRKGKQTSQLTIFDLPKRLDDWRKFVQADAKECCGCAWSYPRMFNYWKNKDAKMGDKVFTQHAGMHISQDKWTRRKITNV